MSGYAYKLGQGSVIIQVKLNDSSTTIADNKGKTGLTSTSTGLIISTICDSESSATTYGQGAGTIESITTNGTYAAPTATKCRFKEIDATNFPGWYEIQIADARHATANAKTIGICIPAVSGLNLAQTDLVIPLQAINPYSIAELFTSQMTESYAADGTAPTPAQALFALLSVLMEQSISGTTVTWKKLDGSTTSMTGTLNSASTPTSITRTT